MGEDCNYGVCNLTSFFWHGKTDVLFHSIEFVKTQAHTASLMRSPTNPTSYNGDFVYEGVPGLVKVFGCV